MGFSIFNFHIYQKTATNKFFFFSFQIKKKQEQLLKVRNFLPPQSQEPEIHLLEKLVDSAVDADKKLESAARGEVNGGKNPFT